MTQHETLMALADAYAGELALASDAKDVDEARAALSDALRTVCADVLDFAKFIARENPLGSNDWACVRCHPNTDIPIAGFVCVAHRAIDAARKEQP
jgi:hypothetical protein